MISRRGFLSGLVALVAAPAVVKADSIMRIKPLSDVWVYDPVVQIWTQDSSAIKITDKLIKENYDVFDMDVWTNLDDMTSKPNAWLDIIANRIRAGTERHFISDHFTGKYKPELPRMELPKREEMEIQPLWGYMASPATAEAWGADPERAKRNWFLSPNIDGSPVKSGKPLPLFGLGPFGGLRK
jgi:hypothetical protein